MLIELGMFVYANSDGTFRVYGNKKEVPFGIILSKPQNGLVTIELQCPCMNKFRGIYSTSLFKDPIKKLTRFQILKGV